MLPIARGRAMDGGLPSPQTIDSIFLPPAADGEEISLLSIYRAVRRHLLLLVSCVVLGIVIAVLYILMRDPLYGATSLVAVGVADADSLSRDSIMETELDYLRSPYFLQNAISALKLDQDPEFNDTLAADSTDFWYSSLTSATDSVKAILTRLGVISPPSPQKQALIDQDAILQNVSDQYAAERPGVSNILSLTVWSTDPWKSVDLANGISELFVQNRMTRLLEAPNQDMPKLQAAVTAARARVDASTAKLEDFRRRAGILRGGQASSTAAAEQLAGATRELISAGTARAEAEATLNQVKSLTRANLTDSALAVMGSPLIQNLREREAELLRQKADVSTALGPKHPQLQGIEASLADLQAKITVEINRLIASQEHQVVIARARERSIQQDVDQISKKVAEQSDAGARLITFERQVEADQKALDVALADLSSATKTLAVATPASAATMLAKAQPDAKPDFPKVPLVLLIGIVGGGCLGAAIALFMEGMRKGFRSGTEVDKRLGIAAFLAPIPRVSRGWFGSRSVDDEVLKPHGTMLREGLRTLYVNLLLSADNKMPRSILVTSCEPEEGKTTIALGLARVLALSGAKTLLIEADLRLPRLQRSLGLKPHPGLVQVLGDEAKLEDCVIDDPKQSGLKILLAGGKTANPIDLLGRRQLTDVMTAVRQQFDCVIIDSPPTMAVGDSRLLVPLAESIILVAKWNSTDRNTVAYAASELGRGGKLPWIVLSMVAPETYGELGFGDSAYTSKAVMRYLSSSGEVAR